MLQFHFHQQLNFWMESLEVIELYHCYFWHEQWNVGKNIKFFWKQIIEILFDENEIVLSHLYCLVRVSQYLWIMLLVNFELYIKINILRLPKTFTILNKSCKLLTNYKRLSLKITRGRINHFIWNPKDSDDTKSYKK